MFHWHTVVRVHSKPHALQEADLRELLAEQELEGANLDVAMAQHLLVAADRYQLSRLRRICERRLCETVEVISCSLLIYESSDSYVESPLLLVHISLRRLT